MKKLLVIGVVLALILTLALPSVAMAAKPTTQISATGAMISIDEGITRELGHSGKWLVKDRVINGAFSSGYFGSEAFTITYGGVFDLATQAGSLVGKMEVGSTTLVITGKSDPLTMVPVDGYYLPCINISGHWTGLKGLNASGTFSAYMVFVPDQGHIGYIVASEFTMTGKTCK
jgi:hypothetical protein